MINDYTIKSVTHMAKADFLQRIRSYYFLIAILVCVFIIYSFVPPVDGAYRMVSLGNYRGFYNSAWIGSMVAMCVPFFALIGFYVVSDAVKRDFDTGVGQIIATTRITRMEYFTGKLISNFVVLLLMLLVIACMTIIMFFVRGETGRLELGKLLFPLLILTLPTMFIIASLALIMDSLTVFRRGVVNIAWFFLWIFIISNSILSPVLDVFGANAGIIDIKNSIMASKSDWNGQYGTGILISDSISKCMVFEWEGMTWTGWIFLQRIFWVAISFGLVWLVSFRFNRFDSSDIREKKHKSPWFMKKKDERMEDQMIPVKVNYHDLPLPKTGFSLTGLVRAELLLMFRGKATLWLIAIACLFIASVFVPLGFAHKYVLPLLWFLQILNLSKLGSREITHRCNEYIFSAAFPLRRQLPATFAAAVAVLVVIATPVMMRELLAGNLRGVCAIATGALFVPSFALASGILTGGSKLFEVIFTILVYGILNGIPYVDFMGAIPGSWSMGIAHYFLLISMILFFLAFSGRKNQITHT
ncbi:MAG: hypothetical protein WCI71_13750 [Bacteroidota bacterium]